MRMYSGKEVVYIVEDFLAEHLNLDTISLKDESVEMLKEILNKDKYGIEVENIVENER